MAAWLTLGPVRTVTTHDLSNTPPCAGRCTPRIHTFKRREAGHVRLPHDRVNEAGTIPACSQAWCQLRLQ